MYIYSQIFIFFVVAAICKMFNIKIEAYQLI